MYTIKKSSRFEHATIICDDGSSFLTDIANRHFREFLDWNRRNGNPVDLTNVKILNTSVSDPEELSSNDIVG